MRLCSEKELSSNICCNTGCYFDRELVWYTKGNMFCSSIKILILPCPTWVGVMFPCLVLWFHLIFCSDLYTADILVILNDSQMTPKYTVTNGCANPSVDLYSISEKSIWKNQVRRTGFLVYFKLDFNCLCSLQTLILKFPVCHNWLFQLDFSKFKYRSTGGLGRVSIQDTNSRSGSDLHTYIKDVFRKRC